MTVCTICHGPHHAASCKHRPAGRTAAQPSPQPVPLTSDQLDDMAYRAKENRQFRRAELEALIAAARERNVLVRTHPEWADAGAWARLQEEMRRRV